ncbi:tetratricopeptide (TPR) repeat protein [Sporomusaceae bacterium BoRhaA]|uniref:hypothetical protein n=1 Tax=Pelorhabdus rhamnosifermentans TaxID=2772457 RepID=UPI001C0600A7|nr:hypothetical protein [Pelorhabdus rhamnosifermentans]MBU2704000.1 tetratricopeptide (TPR) repeat protein [Pelorhabdus rhamnosifermentans]
MELLAVVSLLIGGSPDWVDLLGPQLHHSFRKMIVAFFQLEKDIQLSADDFPFFCDLVMEMTHYDSHKQTETFLQLAKRFFSEETSAQIGTILLKQGFFHYALDMYLYYINRASSVAKLPKLFYCEAGYCCYRLKDFSRAANYFSQALEFGYRKNNIFDFLEWSYQQCPDEVIKEKFELIKELYSK